MKNSLKVERAKKDFTQADLAERVGVSRQTINAIDKRSYNLSTILALIIAKIFETELENIFQLEETDWK